MNQTKKQYSLLDFDELENSEFLDQFDLSNFEEDNKNEHTDYEFQIRNLLALQPVFKLYIYQSNLEKESVSDDAIDEKIDWIYLSLIGLEYIAQVSLFQPGVTLEQFCNYLAKFAIHICPELDQENAYTKSNRVFDALMNQKEKGRDFEFYYYSPKQQKRTAYQFRLIEVDKNHDKPFYRLTKTGTQIYLLMRSINPELYNNAEEMANAIYERWKQNKKLCVYYFGDIDPAGINIATGLGYRLHTLCEKIEFQIEKSYYSFLIDYGIKNNKDFKSEKIALQTLSTTLFGNLYREIEFLFKNKTRIAQEALNFDVLMRKF